MTDRLKKLSLLLALALPALAACTVGPNYVRPEAPVPVAFKEVKGWKLAEPGGTGKLSATWWQLYNDPDLNALEEQVVISNQNLKAAEAQVRQARAIIQEQRAAYFPTLTVGASITRSQRGVTTTNASGGSQSSTVSGTAYSLPFNFSWEADVWGRIRRSVEAASDSYQASEADLAAARLSAQAELAQDYFLLRVQDLQQKLLDETVASYQKAYDLTLNRYKGGVVAKSDLLQAETQLKTARAQAIDLGVQRAQLEHAIALLIGKPASDFALPVRQFTSVVPQIPTGLPSELLERRPDIAGAERRMAAANAQIGVAKAAYYPTVGLSASAGLQSTSFADWFSWPSHFWSVGPVLSQTLFDGGLRRGQNEQVLAAYDQTVANYRQTVLAGFQEVEDNLAALRILEAEALAQEDAVRAAAETVTVALNQYRAGVISYLNVTVAQSTELANRRSAVSILGRRLTASVLLIRALGGGWDAAALADGAKAP
ncbi:outer membrane efflux lipoprotein [Geomonas limicola]|uniref:Outer membrane efflux lipoprotein n=1 Tax=Geomonas limicola TaxID=2740186 RepID=A0A6V8NCW9_9BACT|nr:efflux transporter outer membrane subunit [Geomonas limicola]GFO70478.1 outer membrane efflux lipoprotein [Geomonas limicola]